MGVERALAEVKSGLMLGYMAVFIVGCSSVYPSEGEKKGPIDAVSARPFWGYKKWPGRGGLEGSCGRLPSLTC